MHSGHEHTCAHTFSVSWCVPAASSSTTRVVVDIRLGYVCVFQQPRIRYIKQSEERRKKERVIETEGDGTKSRFWHSLQMTAVWRGKKLQFP